MNTKNINEVYKCKVCGNIVEVLNVGGGELFCCQEPMTLQEENVIDASQEKHLPVIEKNASEIIIVVGEIEHPMEDAHHIEWIEITADEKVYRQNLKPTDKPLAKFKITNTENITARAYCNLHGLWKSTSF